MTERRASDEDRERVQSALRAHYTSGRIDHEELEERLAEAVSAPTTGALLTLTRDLDPPMPPPPPPGSPRPRLSRTQSPPATPPDSAWGLRPFRQQYELICTQAEAWRRAMQHIAPSMTAYGYELVSGHEPDFMTFELSERRGWPWLLGPLSGLLAPKRETRVVISFREIAVGRIQLTAEGSARRPVRRAFAEIGI
jgi:hypothetical protein